MIELTGKTRNLLRTNAVIFVSEEAAKNIAQILKKQDVEALRVAAIGGGCSGLQYRIKLEMNINKFDICFEGDIDVNGALEYFAIVIDPKSYIYLQRIEINLEIQNLNPVIIFRNPGAKTSCSCGMSFEPKDE